MSLLSDQTSSIVKTSGITMNQFDFSDIQDFLAFFDSVESYWCFAHRKQMTQTRFTSEDRILNVNVEFSRTGAYEYIVENQFIYEAEAFLNLLFELLPAHHQETLIKRFFRKSHASLDHNKKLNEFLFHKSSRTMYELSKDFFKIRKVQLIDSDISYNLFSFELYDHPMAGEYRYSINDHFLGDNVLMTKTSEVLPSFVPFLEPLEATLQKRYPGIWFAAITSNTSSFFPMWLRANILQQYLSSREYKLNLAFKKVFPLSDDYLKFIHMFTLFLARTNS